MKRRIAIDRSCMPHRFSVSGPIAIWLLMKHFSAPDWAYGVFWTLVLIVGIGSVIITIRTDYKKLDGFGE